MDTESLTVIIDNELSQLSLLADEVMKLLETKQIQTRMAHDLFLVFDEVLSNIINYGYQEGQAGQIAIDLRYSINHFTLSIIDDGKPFDMTLETTVDTEIPLHQRPLGGLGIFLLQRTVDDMSYVRSDNKNVLDLKKTYS